MMKHTTFVSLTAAALMALSTLSPVLASEKDKDKDDKKAAAVPPALNEEYKLGAGDKLRIEVYKDAQLSQSVQIRPDGKITLPLVGDIQADNKTPIQLRDVISTQLKTYMTNPVVTVIVVETKPAVAYVTGEVNHPGAVQLQD